MIGRVDRIPALAAVLFVLACLGGLGMIAAGLAVPLKADVAQRRLEREFDRARAVATTGRVEEREAPKVAVGLRPARARPTRRVFVPTGAALPASGGVARLIVPRLGVRQIVLAGNGTHEQLAEGPAMLRSDDAVSPVTVLAAHRDTHFLFVRDLRVDDEIVLQPVAGAARRYRVVRFETVQWNRFSIPLDPAGPLLALSTCYPFGGTEYGGPWRRIAWAEKVA